MKLVGEINSVAREHSRYETSKLRVCVHVVAKRQQKLRDDGAIEPQRIDFAVEWSQHAETVYRVGRKVTINVEVK